MSWEARMAARPRPGPFIPPLDDACEILDPDAMPGHYGHHDHVSGNAIVCSCGTVFGCFSIVPDPRYWSDDPAEVEAARRDADAHLASISCRICGEPGVIAREDFGVTAGS